MSKQEPDNYEYRDAIGWCPWYVAFGAAFALLLVGLWLANFTIKHFMQTEQPTVPTKAENTER
jgi:dipeptide/tripeptide permease